MGKIFESKIEMIKVIRRGRAIDLKTAKYIADDIYEHFNARELQSCECKLPRLGISSNVCTECDKPWVCVPLPEPRKMDVSDVKDSRESQYCKCEKPTFSDLGKDLPSYYCGVCERLIKPTKEYAKNYSDRYDNPIEPPNVCFDKNFINPHKKIEPIERNVAKEGVAHIVTIFKNQIEICDKINEIIKKWGK